MVKVFTDCLQAQGSYAAMSIIGFGLSVTAVPLEEGWPSHIHLPVLCLVMKYRSCQLSGALREGRSPSNK